jgi:hypothetical protein
VELPNDASGGRVAYVAPSTQDNAATEETLAGHSLELQPFEVAVVTYR